MKETSLNQKTMDEQGIKVPTPVHPNSFSYGAGTTTLPYPISPSPTYLQQTAAYQSAYYHHLLQYYQGNDEKVAESLRNLSNYYYYYSLPSLTPSPSTLSPHSPLSSLGYYPYPPYTYMPHSLPPSYPLPPVRPHIIPDYETSYCRHPSGSSTGVGPCLTPHSLVSPASSIPPLSPNNLNQPADVIQPVTNSPTSVNYSQDVSTAVTISDITSSMPQSISIDGLAKSHNTQLVSSTKAAPPTDLNNTVCENLLESPNSTRIIITPPSPNLVTPRPTLLSQTSPQPSTSTTKGSLPISFGLDLLADQAKHYAPYSIDSTSIPSSSTLLSPSNNRPITPQSRDGDDILDVSFLSDTSTYSSESTELKSPLARLRDKLKQKKRFEFEVRPSFHVETPLELEGCQGACSDNLVEESEEMKMYEEQMSECSLLRCSIAREEKRKRMKKQKEQSKKRVRSKKTVCVCSNNDSGEIKKGTDETKEGELRIDKVSSPKKYGKATIIRREHHTVPEVGEINQLVDSNVTTNGDALNEESEVIDSHDCKNTEDQSATDGPSNSVEGEETDHSNPAVNVFVNEKDLCCQPPLSLLMLRPDSDLLHVAEICDPRPPDLFGVVFPRERHYRNYYPAEEVYLNTFPEITPHDIKDVPPGTRVACLWSRKVNSSLYPGVVMSEDDSDYDYNSLPKGTGNNLFVLIKLDDNDMKPFELKDIRILPDGFVSHWRDSTTVKDMRLNYIPTTVQTCNNQSSPSSSSNILVDVPSSSSGGKARSRNNSKSYNREVTSVDYSRIKGKQKQHSMVWKWSDKGAVDLKKKGYGKCHKQIERGNLIVKVGDCVTFLAQCSDSDYIGKVLAFYEMPNKRSTRHDNEMQVEVAWMYRPEETSNTARSLPHEKHALFESSHTDINSVSSILDKCDILSYKQFILRIKDKKEMCDNTYYWAGYYNPYYKRIRQKVFA